MNGKLIIGLGLTAVVVFCMAFFRTGAPEIEGLTRPTATLSASAMAKAAPGKVNSRFQNSNEAKDGKKKNVTRRNNRPARQDRINRRQRQNDREKAVRPDNVRNRTEYRRTKAAGMKGVNNASGRDISREEHLERIRKYRDEKKSRAAARLEDDPGMVDDGFVDEYQGDVGMDGDEEGMLAPNDDMMEEPEIIE